MTNRDYGTRADILEAEPNLTEDVHVPEFGNKWFKVRGLSGAQRERYEASLGYIKNGRYVINAKGRAMARLVSMSVVDASGKALFTEEDIDHLASRNAAGLSRIADVARKLSGLTEEDMDELEGNSESDQSDASSSSSPSLSVAPSPNSSGQSVHAS